MSSAKIGIQVVVSIPFVLVFVGLLLFIPAGTIEWLEGWIYLLLLLIFIVSYYSYFMIKNPSTLETREKLSSSFKDKITLFLIGVFFISLLVIPALDYQFQWSQLPLSIKIIGNLGLILSYIIIFLVMKENPFASKGLTIHEDQTVITTGPYAVVRHPMYTSLSLMFLSIPSALGSLITLIPAIISTFLLVTRISNEEKMLLKEFKEYNEYIQMVRYRLIPRIW